MDATARARACAIGLSSLLVVFGWGHIGRAGDDGGSHLAKTPAERGRRIFLHEWKAKDPLGRGDGLGPVFNNRSCVACHFEGGIGGAGSNEQNIELLTAVVPADMNELKKFPGRAKSIHPAFEETTSIVLHRFGTNPSYESFRKGLFEGDPFGGEPANPPARILAGSPSSKQITPPPIGRLAARSGVELLLTQRNTPALFGAGLIDSIAPERLARLAEEQAKDHWPISGRVVGRFGWRGQIAELREFVLGACANEVGLQVPQHAQGLDPCNPTKLAPALDLSAQQCSDLIAYIATLPRPRQLPVEDRPDFGEIEQGRTSFENIGCAVCHRPYIGVVDGIYSDLLVHDMGPWLADPVAAPTHPVQASSSPGRPSGYFGGSSESESLRGTELAERRNEWRTPPLWGVRNSAPYLHDGRAATIDDAIRWHGGEAAGVLETYLALDATDRQNLVLFLTTLAAPEVPAELAAK